jgi:hypothetical protein
MIPNIEADDSSKLTLFNEPTFFIPPWGEKNLLMGTACALRRQSCTLRGRKANMRRRHPPRTAGAYGRAKKFVSNIFGKYYFAKKKFS